MTPHRFVHTGIRVDRADWPKIRGRRPELCGVEACTARRTDPVHRSPAPSGRWETDRVAERRAVAERHRARLAAIDAEPAIAALRAAVGAVLALPADAIGWRLRLRVLDVQAGLDIRGDEPLLPALDPDPPRPVRAYVAPTLARPSRRHAVRPLLKRLDDETRELAVRALDSGWEIEKRGGHLTLVSPGGPTVSLTTSRSYGHAYANARSKAKRLGLDVEGL